MMPILLISQDKDQIEQYISNYKKENKITDSCVFKIEKQETMIKIDQIRAISQLIERTDKNKKLLIINDFDTAKKETQNALLKTLEDQAENINIILITATTTNILTTIISRTKVVKLYQQIKNITELPWLIDQQINLDDKLLKSQKIKKEEAVNLIDDCLIYFNSSPDKGAIAKSPFFLKEVIRIRDLIIKNNLNPERAIDHLILSQHMV